MASEKSNIEIKPEAPDVRREAVADQFLENKFRPDISLEKPENKKIDQNRTRKTISPATDSVPAANSGWHGQRAAAIDAILSEGLNEIFLSMRAAEQKAFAKKGEETVAKINELLNGARVKINKIISLIKNWLKMIPGVNKFFLEQEAKIKADKILKLKNRV